MLPASHPTIVLKHTLPRPLLNTPKACTFKARMKFLLSILQLAAW